MYIYIYTFILKFVYGASHPSGPSGPSVISLQHAATKRARPIFVAARCSKMCQAHFRCRPLQRNVPDLFLLQTVAAKRAMSVPVTVKRARRSFVVACCS